MSLVDAFRSFWAGLTKGETIAVTTAAPISRGVPVRSSSGEMVRVVDAMTTAPTQADIPGSWSRSFMGPGAPIGGLITPTARERDREQEPRTFDYQPSINATISPRVAYGLLAFTELRRIAETVPEVGMCIRIITEEIKSFRPRILDPNGVDCKDPTLRWMYTTPDLFNPWPVWLSRFLYNVLVYDAGSIYRPRDSRGRIMALRVIDGSTLFVLIDERGEQPAPPAPAFTQVIHGIPRNYLNTYQIWYRPRHLRADAPYGRSPIEDALPAVNLLENLWDYEGKWYTEGNVPEQALTTPPNWTADQILEFERAFNARMAGNSEERSGRIRFLPNGVESLSLKDATFKKEVSDWAANAVRMSFGVPITETGETPGTGLGGTGFLEAMQSLFYRLCVAPIKAYIEAPFNETLEENGYEGYTFDLAFPKDSLDPAKEEDKHTARFTQGLITRDEARVGLGLHKLGGEEGKFLIQPGQGQESVGFDSGLPLIGRMDSIPVRRKIPVAHDMIPVKEGGQNHDEGIRVRKMYGVAADDDAYFGAPVIMEGGKALIGVGRLEMREADWDEIEGGRSEAVYLIDRALAPDDQRYLVPLTYQSESDGRMGLVRAQSFARRAYSADRYGEDWIEQAAVLDWIAGIERRDEYGTHPEDPERPILFSTANSFVQPDSAFARTFVGRELSKEMLQSIEAAVGDRGLWRDVADCAGEEAAQEARKRAVSILRSGSIPEV